MSACQSGQSDELRAHMRRRGLTDKQSAALFEALDENEDGVLSREELAAGLRRARSGEPTLKQRDFQRLLLSNENSAIDPKHNRVHMDMTRPLSHYWVHSSHNTYLTGDQFTSASDARMYERILLQGCRCIECLCRRFDGKTTGRPTDKNAPPN